MAIDVKVPAVGESIVEGMIGKWHKNNGEFVNKDDVLLELETDKATVDIVAEASGTLEVLAPQGKVVKVGEVIARMQEGAGNTQTPKAVVAPSPTPSPAQASPERNGPAVSRIAKEEGIDLSKVQGTGRDGRVTKKDLLTTGSQTSAGGHPAASPETSRAKESPVSMPVFTGAREEIRKPMSMLRRRIAERLIHSQNTTATLTTFNEVDMTEVMALRDKYKETFFEKHGVKLGFMSFFVKASIAALKACPEVNAYIDGTDILYHNYCDVGVAVSTEKGLMVPIIRNADQMSLAQLEKAIAEFAVKARQNKITLEDLSGGTFTVSNGGVFGSLLSTPILNPPQTAIMGMHKTQMRPMVMADGSIKARPMMYLAMSYDHRILDGKEAVTFLVKIKEGIEDPSRLLLDV